MVDQNYGTPPPPPKKGGLPTWAWIVLGCLLIAILGAGATCFGVAYLAKKAGEKITQKANEYQNDPSAFAMDAAEFALKNNPDVEFISADREAKTFTFRDKKTGQETTVSLADVENGNFSISADGKEVNVDVNGGEGGSINVTGPDGQRLQIGGGGADLPEWVPTYPGSNPKGVGMLQTGSERSGTVTFTTTDSIKAILDHYEQGLKGAGFNIDLRSVSGNDGGLISASGQGRNVTVAIGQNAGENQVSVTFTEKTGG